MDRGFNAEMWVAVRAVCGRVSGINGNTEDVSGLDGQGERLVLVLLLHATAQWSRVLAFQEADEE